MNDIPRAERLIVALDVPAPAEARALVEMASATVNSGTSESSVV